jgi:hypothetical protein
MLSSSLPWELACNKWAGELNKIIANPLQAGKLFKDVVLQIGDNVINHSLKQPPIGYFVCMSTAASVYYDKQKINPHAELTLILNSSAVTTVNIYIF